MGSSLYSFLCSPSIFCSFLRVSGSTSFLALFFGVSGVFIFALLINNLKFFGRFVFSLTTPSNLGFLGFFGFQFFGGGLLTCIEIAGKLIRVVSLTCRLGANISAGHLLSAIFFGIGSTNFLVRSFLIFYFIFEFRISAIQGFVYSFLLSDYREKF